MLSVIKPGSEPRQPTDVNAVISDLKGLIEVVAGSSIQVETALSDQSLVTICDPHQLENALINLTTNARDSMPGGGRLRIETSEAHLSLARQELRAGSYVAISVADTGIGMSEEVLAHAFDPFFTTKDASRGTGLGLSTVRRFVQAFGGHVGLDSAPGRGTSLTLFFPRQPNASNGVSEQSVDSGATGFSKTAR
jgi:signal transduction histidine kinase